MVNLPYNSSMLFPNYSTTARMTLINLNSQRATADENSKPKIDLAINLICLRQDAHKGQTEVAKALHIDQKNFSQWERAEVAPSLRYLLALANYYGVTVDDLLKPKEF